MIEHPLVSDLLQLQDIKANKNDYIILAGDLNVRIGNTPIDNVTEAFGEQFLNRNGQKLIDFSS
jgi:hypothetical protein